MKINIEEHGNTVVTYDSTTHPRVGESVIVDQGGMSYREGVVTKVETLIRNGTPVVFVHIA